MATSQYTYHPYHTIGAATVQLWDPNAGGEEVSGAWRPLGKVADAAVIISTEQASKDLTVKGLTQPLARRNRAKRYSLSFRLLEDANPLTLDLLGSEGAAQSQDGLELVFTSEVLRLFDFEWREVGHPYGIAAVPPEGVSDAMVTAGGTGGAIPPGTYFFWVVPYLESSGNTTFEGLSFNAGSTPVSAGEKVTVTFTPPGSWNPDGYRVYYNTIDSLEGASLAATGTESPIVITGFSGALTYSPQDGPLVVVRDYDGTAEYIVDSDYGLDVGKGLLKRATGGLIPDGAQVVVSYAYWRPPSVSTPLGDPVDLERYRRVRLLQLAPDDPDPAAWRETGVEFTFFKVNVSMNDSRWPFSENDFSEGASMAWDCLFDGGEGKVGEARSTYGVLAAYE